MTDRVAFIIEEQKINPQLTEVMNPLVESIVNWERSLALGKTALLNPTTIEVILGTDIVNMRTNLKVASWHQTAESAAGRLQMHETAIDLGHDGRGFKIMGESGRLYAMSQEQIVCGAALLITTACGALARQVIENKKR